MTEFGKHMKKIRSGTKENMREMAIKLGVSAAFLSATEVGKKKIPLKWIERISTLYNIDSEGQKELERVVLITNKKLSINLDELGEEEKDVSIMFARSIEHVKPDTLEKLRKILEENE